MKITLAMVMSLDGRITREDDDNIYLWTSPEDQDYFFDLIKQQSLIVMGSQTYQAAKSLIKHQPGTLRIVLTSRPEGFLGETVPGQLEFSNESPANLVDRLTQKGFESMLLVGGPSVASSFLEQRLVDEVWLTIEPVAFGEGKMLLNGLSDIVKLKLFSIKKLNEKGTILVKYRVDRKIK